MFRRCGYLPLLAMTLTMFSGCAYEAVCTLRDSAIGNYQASHWMGSSCGQFYWSEWFNSPPDCCEPCNQCGYYTGGGQGCLRSYTRERRQALVNSLFGPSDCQFGHYALDGNGCGGVDGCSGCSTGNCGGGFVLGFHRFVDRVWGNGPFAPGPTPAGCACGGHGMNQGDPQETPYGEGYEEVPSVRQPTPANELPPPPPASMQQQSKRSRVLKPASYTDAYDDVFDDEALPQDARGKARAANGAQPSN